jgi:exopolyphosphatase / guanosine-5'-triphosphate,3'-diphosphate pyrophosphatase
MIIPKVVQAGMSTLRRSNNGHEQQEERVRERTIGVVDIGSNTVHLLVAGTNGRRITPLIDSSEALGLGLEVDYEGTISPEKTRELIETLRAFQDMAAAEGVTDLHLLATHAIRTAANRDEMTRAIEEAVGLRVEVLTPEEEAEFGFLGADTDCPSVGPQVVVDIGGGSVQISVGQHGEVWDCVSLPLGAARVANNFLPSDPPTYLEEALLVTYLAKVVISALPLPDANVTGVLGIGGSLRRSPQVLGLKPGDSFPNDSFDRILSRLRSRKACDIAAEFDLKPERARLLFPAILVIREVLRGYDFPPFIVSSYGMREGAILSLARRPLLRAL